MAKDKSRFSDSQNSKKEAANRPNQPDTSNTFDVSETPSPPQKNTRPQTTRPNLPSRPEPQAILPDRLNSRPAQPRSNPGRSRPPIYRPGTALPDSNETIPGETSSPKPVIKQQPSSRPAAVKRVVSKPALPPPSATKTRPSQPGLPGQSTSQIAAPDPSSSPASISKAPASRPSGSKPKVSRPSKSLRPPQKSLPLEEQTSPEIIRLRRKDETFPLPAVIQNNSDSRPSNPSIRRDTATTPITLPRRRYTSNSAHIRPELHPRNISVNKDANFPRIQSNLDEGEATQKLGPASEETAVKDTNTKIDPDTNPTAQVIDADSAEIDRVTDPAVTNTQATSEIITDPAALTITPATTSKTSLQANSAEEQVQPQSPIRARLRRFHIQPLRLFNHVLALLLVGLACFSVVELALDMTSSHLIVSSINPESGVIQSRQDSGTRFATDTQITTPTQLPEGLFFATQDGRQNQLYMLHGGTLTPLDHEIQTMTATPGVLTTTPNGNLLVTSQTGVSLLTPTGKQIWSIPGSHPTSGAHTFQPAFDQKNMYTVKSTYTNQIAAYSLTSGQERWSQTLSDTLDYAPPFLVDAKQLYVASDHQISALSLDSGKILWKAALPIRTLLMVSGSKPLLLSAGINGLTALDPQKGTILWKASLSPRSSVSASSLTSVQFYQASLNSAGTVVFASGTSWESPAVREHVWLAAFETKTGQNLWSKETAAGFLNADSNRTLPLLVDDQHNLVIQQLQPQPLNRTLRAFDTTSGNQRWQTNVDRVQGTSSSLLQQQDGSFILASTTTDTWQLPASWLIERIGFVVALGLSLLGLGILAITVWLLDKRSRPQTVPEEQLLAPNEERSKLQTYSPQIAGAVLLLLFIGAGVFAYFELHGTGIINALDMRNGIADKSGNVFVSAGENLNHQITAVDSQGNTRWQNLSSEGQMSVLPDTQSPHSVLVLVRGHLPQGYRYAPTDIAYPNPLESLEILYRFDRQSGALQWQTILNPAGSSSEATILGNDPRQIYIASLGQDTSNKLQLYALEQATGNLLWTLTIPHTNHVTSTGSFIGKGSERIWQVDGKTYTIDINAGKIVLHS